MTSTKPKRGGAHNPRGRALQYTEPFKKMTVSLPPVEHTKVKDFVKNLKLAYARKTKIKL